MSPSNQLQENLGRLAKYGKFHDILRLSNSQQLKTGRPKGNWFRRIFKPLTSQQIDSIHRKQKQDAAELINRYASKNPLQAREITVGQALLQLNPPASDEEFLEYLKQDQYKIHTRAGRALIDRYLGQKFLNNSQTVLDVLAEIQNLIPKISDSDSRAGKHAGQWLSLRIMYHLLAETPEYEKTFTEVLNKPAFMLNVHSFYDIKDNIESCSSFLPEYFKKAALVNDLPVTELKELKTQLVNKGVSLSDPIYQQTIIRLASQSKTQLRAQLKTQLNEQPAEAVQTQKKMIANRQRDLTMLVREMEETRIALVNEEQRIEHFEQDKESMSPEDIQEALWVGSSKSRIEGYKLKQTVLSQWIECINAELERLGASQLRVNPFSMSPGVGLQAGLHQDQGRSFSQEASGIIRE